MLKAMATPRTVEANVTSRCNLRCRYCSFFDNSATQYQDLPTGPWLRFFDECGDCGVMNVVLAGGEPFIREDLRTLIEGIVHNRMRFELLSNGALIDDGMAAFLSDTGRCNHVQVSVDGSKPETHDACRGRGAFAGAVRGLRILQQHGVPTTARVTVHHHNVHDLENVARLLLEELGLERIGTNSAGYLGSCRQHAADVLLTPEDRQEAMEALLRLSARYEGRISAAAGPLAEGRRWREMGEARAAGSPAFSNGGRLTGCGCPFDKIAVQPDGAFAPCALLPHLELGRMGRDPLVDVWRHSPVLSRLRARSDIPLDRFPFCAECAYVPYCTGNCPGLAYALTGEVDHPSPDACLRRFLQQGGALPAAAEAAV